ncbi:MAG TPA: C4-type zinc ribbon domain-containing protein [Syntrophorhabdaceae bacterium]|nr:C4-type zinc ribbon domain-containing protein [Syntrophorhabdaceae bacterium]
MEQELGTLFEAQKIESMIMENEQKLLQAPIKLKTMEEEMSMVRQKIEKEKEIIEELDKERRKKEKELETDKEKIKKLEVKLYDVKTNKEYQALLKEIEAAKETNDRTEEDVLVLMDKIEDLRKDNEASTEQLKKREKESEVEKIEIEKEIQSMDEIITRLTTERDNLLSVVSDNLRNIYGILRERRGGVAVTNVKNGVCMGCHMNIPPQLFIEVTKNKKLIQCPSCNRILFFREND